jgi:hypothetical protein
MRVGPDEGTLFMFGDDAFGQLGHGRARVETADSHSTNISAADRGQAATYVPHLVSVVTVLVC